MPMDPLYEKRRYSLPDERMAAAVEAVSVLKKLDQTPTAELVSTRMARKLPESVAVMRKFLMDMGTKSREEIGIYDNRRSRVYKKPGLATRPRFTPNPRR